KASYGLCCPKPWRRTAAQTLEASGDYRHLKPMSLGRHNNECNYPHPAVRVWLLRRAIRSFVADGLLPESCQRAFGRACVAAHVCFAVAGSTLDGDIFSDGPLAEASVIEGEVEELVKR